MCINFGIMIEKSNGMPSDLGIDKHPPEASRILARFVANT